MTLRHEFQAASEEYARTLDEWAEAERLAALRLEARRAGNAQAFADALASTFDALEAENADTAPPIDDLADLAGAIRNDTEEN
jgi:hypothetical protein